MALLIGGIVGLLMTIGVPLWMGSNDVSPVWLLAISLITVSIGMIPRWNTTYNMLAEARAHGGLFGAAFTLLLLPWGIYTVILLIPFYLAVWIWG